MSGCSFVGDPGFSSQDSEADDATDFSNRQSETSETDDATNAFINRHGNIVVSRHSREK